MILLVGATGFGVVVVELVVDQAAQDEAGVVAGVVLGLLVGATELLVAGVH